MIAALPPYHPVIELWPPLRKSESENVRSQMKKGLKQDIRAWTDAGGKEWLVSGRDLVELESSLVADGVLDAKSDPLRLVDVGKMSELEMIDHIAFDSRNGCCTGSMVNEGQKAVVALLAYKLMSRFGGPKEKWPEGKECGRLGQKAGASRNYIYDAITLDKRAPWLLDEVFRGNVRINVAVKSLQPDGSHPEELDDDETLFEGAKRQVTVNAYERNGEARRKCLAKYGYVCHVCNFNFEEEYGEIGRQFIHVHHLVELAAIGKEYRIDAIRDLRPVCPNCRAMLHKREPAFSIEELQKRLKKR